MCENYHRFTRFLFIVKKVDGGWWIVCGENAVLSKLASNNWEIHFKYQAQESQLIVY